MSHNNTDNKGFSRRQLLKYGAAAGAGIWAMSKMNVRRAEASPIPPPVSLTPFIDPLPLPPVLAPDSFGEMDGEVNYFITADQITHQWHTQLPPTPQWGFNNMFPGPVVTGYKDAKTTLTIQNNLQSFVLPVDPRLHGANSLFINGLSNPPVPYITIHNHGIETHPEFDGLPDDRFPPGVSYTYEYPNINEPATYFYHDHSLGVTRLSVYSGLAGLYILRDLHEFSNPDENRFGLPTGKYEIPLAIIDKAFNPDGTLWYPPIAADLANSFPDSFTGNVISVNGKVWPYHNVEKGVHLLRILNASNHTEYELVLQISGSSERLPFHVVGTDGGYLSHVVEANVLLMASAERISALVDFSGLPAGTEVLLLNIKQDAYSPVEPVMKFIVEDETMPSFTIPSLLEPYKQTSPPIATRYHSLVHGADSEHLLDNRKWHEAPTELPKAGSTEIWYMFNLTDDPHPMHLHATQFFIEEIQAFDKQAFFDANGLTGPYTDPQFQPTTRRTVPRYLRGLKDTVRVPIDHYVKLRVPFAPFKGRFAWHCHMLEHEDNEMMRPLFLV